MTIAGPYILWTVMMMGHSPAVLNPVSEWPSKQECIAALLEAERTIGSGGICTPKGYAPVLVRP